MEQGPLLTITTTENSGPLLLLAVVEEAASKRCLAAETVRLLSSCTSVHRHHLQCQSADCRFNQHRSDRRPATITIAKRTAIVLWSKAVIVVAKSAKTRLGAVAWLQLLRTSFSCFGGSRHSGLQQQRLLASVEWMRKKY